MPQRLGNSIGLAPLPGLLALLLGLLTLLIIRKAGYTAAVGYVGFMCLSLFLDTSWVVILGVTLLIIMVLVCSIVVPER